MQPQSPINPVSPAVSPVPANSNTSNEMIPSEWPGGLYGPYKYSKNIVKRNWVLILVLILLSGVISSILSTISDSVPSSSKMGVGLVTNLLNYVASSIFQFAIVFAFIAGAKNSTISIGESLNKSISKIVNILIYVSVSSAIMIASFLLFIIPFFFIAPRLAFGYFLIVDKDMGPIEAIQASWAMTKGSVGNIYKICIGMILICLLMFTIIGIPFAIYLLFMYQAGLFVLYKFIDNKGGMPQTGVNNQPATPNTPRPNSPAVNPMSESSASANTTNTVDNVADSTQPSTPSSTPTSVESPANPSQEETTKDQNS